MQIFVLNSPNNRGGYIKKIIRFRKNKNSKKRKKALGNSNSIKLMKIMVVAGGIAGAALFCYYHKPTRKVLLSLSSRLLSRFSSENSDSNPVQETSNTSNKTLLLKKIAKIVLIGVALTIWGPPGFKFTLFTKSEPDIPVETPSPMSIMEYYRNVVLLFFEMVFAKALLPTDMRMDIRNEYVIAAITVARFVKRLVFRELR